MNFSALAHPRLVPALSQVLGVVMVLLVVGSLVDLPPVVPLLVVPALPLATSAVAQTTLPEIARLKP